MSNKNETLLLAIKDAIITDATIADYVKQVFIALSPEDVPDYGRLTPLIVIAPTADRYNPLGLSCAASDVYLNVAITYYEEFWPEDAVIPQNNCAAGVLRGQRDLVRCLNRNLLGLAVRALYQGGTFALTALGESNNVHSVTLNFEYFYFDEGV